MGVLPLEFEDGQSAESVGLTGAEIFDIDGMDDVEARSVEVRATPEKGRTPIRFRVTVRLDTPQERLYYAHGGILQYVLCQMMDQP